MLPHYLNLIPILYWEIFLKLEKKFQALLEKKNHTDHGSSVMTCLGIRMPVQPRAYYAKKKNLLFFFLSEETSWQDRLEHVSSSVF
jgi:hypothetical protein